jgi:cyanate lyase
MFSEARKRVKEIVAMKMASRKQKAEEFARLLPILAADSDFVTAITLDAPSLKDFETVIHNHATTLNCSSLCNISFRDIRSQVLSLDVSDSDPTIQELYAAFQLYSDQPVRKKRRQNTANRMGFTPTSNIFKSLPVIKLPR